MVTDMGAGVPAKVIAGDGSPRNKKNLQKKVITVLLIILALLLIGVLGFFIKKSLTKHNPADNMICNTTANQYLLKDAASETNISQLSSLSDTVEKIKQLPNYQKDPNCDYVVLTYYINQGDLTSANTYFSKLKQVYNTKQGYNQYLKPIAKSMSTLSDEITVVQQSYNQAAKRATFIKAP